MSNFCNLTINKNYRVNEGYKSSFKKVKASISSKQLLNERNTQLKQLSNKNFEDTMHSNIFKGLKGYLGCGITESINSYISGEELLSNIDNIVKKERHYKNYINKNFHGTERKEYLKSLNENIDYAKDVIADSIVTKISCSLSCTTEELKDIKKDITSIIDNKIVGRNNSNKLTSIKDINYKDLKNIITGIDSINENSTSNSFINLGYAAMKANFINEKTDLPASIKAKFLENVENQKNAILMKISLDEVFKRSMGREEYNKFDKMYFDRLKKTTTQTYNNFSKLNFSKNFTENFIDELQRIENFYSKNKEYFNNANYESEKVNYNNFASRWNNFINKIEISEEKSKYFLPSDENKLIDVLI